MDIKELKKIFSIQATENISEVIYFWTNYLNTKDIHWKFDSGNILITKGKPPKDNYYPCYAAHMDTVATKFYKDYRVDVYDLVDKDKDKKETSREKDCLIAHYVENKEQKRCMIGGDDKCGMFVIYKLLRKLDYMKACLFWGEETGCKGSALVDISFFDDCAFIAEFDRKGSKDLITEIGSSYYNEICSDKFIEAVKEIDDTRIACKGNSTDVGKIRDSLKLSCINTSCGYYNPHTENDYIKIAELYDAVKFGIKLAQLSNKRWGFDKKDKPKQVTTLNNYGYNNLNYRYYNEDRVWCMDKMCYMSKKDYEEYKLSLLKELTDKNKIEEIEKLKFECKQAFELWRLQKDPDKAMDDMNKFIEADDKYKDYIKQLQIGGYKYTKK